MKTYLDSECRSIAGTAPFKVIDIRLASALRLRQWNTSPHLFKPKHATFDLIDFDIIDPAPIKADLRYSPSVNPESKAYHIGMDVNPALETQRYVTIHLTLHQEKVKGMASSIIYICEYEKDLTAGYIKFTINRRGWCTSLENAILELNDIFIDNSYANRDRARELACKKIGPIDHELTSKLLQAVGINAIGGHS